MAEDFAYSLVMVQCTDVLKGEDATLPIKQVAQPSSQSFNQTMLWFEVDVSKLVAESKDFFVYLQI